MAITESNTDLAVNGLVTTVKVTDDARSNIANVTHLSEYVQTLYSVVLYNTDDNEVLEAPGLDPANRTNKAEYFFTVPPKSYEVQEPFTPNIQVTQNGGRFVESYGSLIKTIRVTGTTGLRPNKKSVNKPYSPYLSVSQANIDELLGKDLNLKRKILDPTEATGYDDLVFLRNLFRKYSDTKFDAERAGSTIMLWRNNKDLEYWIVEPEDFKVSQNSKSPLTYEYTISFKTLGRFEYTYSLGRDPQADAWDRDRFFARIQSYSQNLMGMFTSLGTDIRRMAGAANFLRDTVLGPLLAVINGLTSLKGAVSDSMFSALSALTILDTNLITAIDKLGKDLDPTEDVDRLIRSLRRLLVEIEHIFTEDQLMDDPSRRSVRVRAAEAYATRDPSLPGRPAIYASVPVGTAYDPAVAEDTVAPGDTIEDLADRLLGDPTGWRDLVEINRLVYPYVGVEPMPGVLVPGDKILYPAPRVKQSKVMNGPKTRNRTLAMDAYGTDIRLQTTGPEDSSVTDIGVSSTGDLGLITGLSNMNQAILLKFVTETGELPAHRRYGSKFPLGAKMTPSAITEVRISTAQTVHSDTRVKGIKDMQFVSTGDKLGVKLDLELLNENDVVPVSLALRRF